jgi:hypothetical protein
MRVAFGDPAQKAGNFVFDGVLAGVCQASLDESLAEALVGKKQLDSAGQGTGIARWDEQAVVAVLDRRRDATGARGDDGQTLGHGFQEHLGLLVLERGQDEEVAAAIVLPEGVAVGDEAVEGNASGEVSR